MSLHTMLMDGTDGPVAILDVQGFPILRSWYIVYPKGKELSLVAQTFLDFVISTEIKILERMHKVWPKLEDILKENKKTESKKKNNTTKKSTKRLKTKKTLNSSEG